MMYSGHHLQEAQDRNGSTRSAIIFELRRKAVWNKQKAEEDAKDASFQLLVDYTPAVKNLPDGPLPPPPPAKRSGSVAYSRNPGVAKGRLEEIGYKCEVDPNHITFTSRATKKPYIEAHHLVPVGRQGDFPNANLDVPENILALCPLCHRKFHHAVREPQFELVDKFLQLKKDKLKSRGIIISTEELRRYYAVEVIHEE